MPPSEVVISALIFIPPVELIVNELIGAVPPIAPFKVTIPEPAVSVNVILLPLIVLLNVISLLVVVSMVLALKVTAPV